MTRFYYSRVSTSQQNLDRQTAISQRFGIDPTNIYEEKQSGRTIAKRLAFQELMSKLQAGDELYVESFSRLSRSLSDLLKICAEIDGKGVVLISEKEGKFDGSTATGRLYFGMMALLSQYEVDIAAERRMEGQRIRREKTGQSGGRKPTPQSKLDTATALYLKGDMTAKEIADTVGISRSRLYKHLKEHNVTRD